MLIDSSSFHCFPRHLQTMEDIIRIYGHTNIWNEDSRFGWSNGRVGTIFHFLSWNFRTPSKDSYLCIEHKNTIFLVLGHFWRCSLGRLKLGHIWGLVVDWQYIAKAKAKASCILHLLERSLKYLVYAAYNIGVRTVAQRAWERPVENKQVSAKSIMREVTYYKLFNINNWFWNVSCLCVCLCVRESVCVYLCVSECVCMCVRVLVRVPV